MGDAILLEGVLGAGKSAFARAFLRAASGDPALEVPSPSFTLVQSYDTRRGTVHHFDLWRLDGPDALAELGWDEACRDIVLVEWPDRLGALRPPTALTIALRLEPSCAAAGGAERLARPDRGAVMKAMLLAAGLDERMRPLNTHTPTSLLPLGGRISFAGPRAGPAARCRGDDGGGQRTWQAERIAAHLAARGDEPRLVVRRRGTLLGTGGSIRAALDVLGPEPFFVVNGDAFWLDGPSPTATRASAFPSWEEIEDHAA